MQSLKQNKMLTVSTERGNHSTADDIRYPAELKSSSLYYILLATQSQSIYDD